MYTCKKEEIISTRERDALIRQQNAKARGEIAIRRLQQSMADQHNEKAVELEVLADLLSLRATELLDLCSTSSEEQDILTCDNLLCSITALNRLSEQHKNSSQEILTQAKERYAIEEFRQMKVKEAVRDFNKCGQGST